MKRKKWLSRLMPILAAAALSASLTACGGAAGSKASYQMAIAETAAETTAASYKMGAAPMAVPNGIMEEGAYDMAAEEAAFDSVLSSSTAIQPVSTNRKLIRTVNLNVETTEFDQLISNISQAVSDAGGYMESSDVSGTSISDSYGRRYAYLTVRIPAERLDQFVTLVSEQGNITNKSESTQDVTLQYSDIESRKKSLRIEQDRLWKLLEKADSMESIIALEERLSEIRYQLESFESQLRTYDNQVDYSTVSISVNEVKVLTPTTPDSVTTRIQKGFRRNLENVCNGMVNFFVWLVSSLPSLIVLAVILVLLVILFRTVSRILRRRTEKPKPAPKPEDPKV